MGFSTKATQATAPAKVTEPVVVPPAPLADVRKVGARPDFLLKIKNDQDKFIKIGSCWKKTDKTTGRETGALEIVFEPGVSIESTDKDRCRCYLFPNDADQKFKRNS